MKRKLSPNIECDVRPFCSLLRNILEGKIIQAAQQILFPQLYFDIKVNVCCFEKVLLRFENRRRKTREMVAQRSRYYTPNEVALHNTPRKGRFS